MAEALKLPELFNQILEEPVNDLLLDCREQGKKIIGYTCSYVPAPILSVKGLVPLRVRAPGVAGTQMADTYLSSVICSYTRSLLEYALDGRYQNLDGWVFTASCDHLRRLADNLEYLSGPNFCHVLDLPHKLSREALAWWVTELQTLVSRLSETFEINIDDQALSEAIKTHNRILGLLRAIGDTRHRPRPPITGTQFLTLLIACWSAPPEIIEPALNELLNQIKSCEPVPKHRARLMVVGSQLDDPGYLRIIEQTGGLVVADRFCVGSLPGLDQVVEGLDPLQALAEASLRKTSCPRMMEEFDSRVNDILVAVRDFAVDGVVLQAMKFCDTWGVESSPLSVALRDKGIPVLRLEREYSLTGVGQLRTRVQAFLESMGK